MANAFPTICPRAAKAPFTDLTPYARQFIALLNVLGYHINDERSLDRTALSEATYPNRLERTESTRSELYDVLLACLEARATEVDKPLRRMTLVIATLIREERGPAFSRYAELRNSIASFLEVPGDGPIATRLSEMLAAADKRIMLMAGLSCYRTEGATCESHTELIAA